LLESAVVVQTTAFFGELTKEMLPIGLYDDSSSSLNTTSFLLSISPGTPRGPNNSGFNSAESSDFIVNCPAIRAAMIHCQKRQFGLPENN